MKTHAFYILAIVGLIGVIWFQWDQAKDEQLKRLLDNGKAQVVIEDKTAEILKADTVIQALGKKLKADSLKHRVALNASNAVIQAHKKTISRLRPLITPELAENDTLLAFVNAQDSVISNQDSLIREQELFCTAQITDLKSIIKLHVQQYEDQKSITSAVTKQLEVSTWETRKEKRGKKFWQWTAGIVTGIALYLSVK